MLEWTKILGHLVSAVHYNIVSKSEVSSSSLGRGFISASAPLYFHVCAFVSGCMWVGVLKFLSGLPTSSQKLGFIWLVQSTLTVSTKCSMFSEFWMPWYTLIMTSQMMIFWVLLWWYENAHKTKMKYVILAYFLNKSSTTLPEQQSLQNFMRIPHHIYPFTGMVK